MQRVTGRNAKRQQTCSNTSMCFITAVIVIRRSTLYRGTSSCETGSLLGKQKMRQHNPGPLEGEKKREDDSVLKKDSGMQVKDKKNLVI
jgi:hypothetical protein